MTLLVVNMTPAGSQLIDEGEVVSRAARGDIHAQATAQSWSLQKRALAKLVWRAKCDHPALMLRAIFEGWSATKIRYEIHKKLGLAGKGEAK